MRSRKGTGYRKKKISQGSSKDARLDRLNQIEADYKGEPALADPSTLGFHMARLVSEGMTIAEASSAMGVKYATGRNALHVANRELNERTRELIPVYQSISLQQTDMVMHKLMNEMHGAEVLDEGFVRKFEKVMKIRMELLGMGDRNSAVNVQINNTFNSGDPLYHQAQGMMIDTDMYEDNPDMVITQQLPDRAIIIEELEDIIDDGEA